MRARETTAATRKSPQLAHATVPRFLPAAIVAALGLGAADAACGTSSASPRLPDVDDQIWSEVDAVHPLTPTVSFTASIFGGTGNDLPNPTFEGIGGELDFKNGSWTDSAGGYAVSVRSPVTGQRISGALPFVQVTYQFRQGDLSLTDRNRVDELAGFPGAPIRYRNRLAADWRIERTGTVTDVIVAEEGFYDWSHARWTTARTQVGCELALSRRVTTELSAVRQRTDLVTPHTLNAVWVVLQIRI
jgi:hypothetical protein